MSDWNDPDAGSKFNPQSFGNGLGGFLGGLFGNSDKPYKEAEEQYKKYYDQAPRQANAIL